MTSSDSESKDKKPNPMIARDNYFKLLQTWIDTANHWNAMQLAAAYSTSQKTTENAQNSNQQLPNGQAFTWNPQFVNNVLQPPANGPLQAEPRTNLPDYNLLQTYPYNFAQTRPTPTTFEFKIPPLWKRLAAEFIDFIILFIVKLALTFLLMESFSFVNLELYGFEAFQKNFKNPEITYPVALELITLELVHRLVVCIYETYFLKGFACATPGKKIMGLMVIKANQISLVPGRPTETISARDAARPGFQTSLARSFSKNLVVSLLLPLCFTFYIFPQNRTSYDMMWNTVVVEVNQEFLRFTGSIILVVILFFLQVSIKIKVGRV